LEGTVVGPAGLRSSRTGPLLPLLAGVVSRTLDACRGEPEASSSAGVGALGLRASRRHSFAAGPRQSKDRGHQTEAESRAASFLHRVLPALRLRAGSGVAVPTGAEGKDRAVLQGPGGSRDLQPYISEPRGVARRGDGCRRGADASRPRDDRRAPDRSAV